MYHKIKFCLSALSIVVIASSAIAEEITRVGTTAMEFLKIGVGSRAMGMGGAYTGIANDASCLYWNPASAANMQGIDLMLQRNNWLVDTEMSYLGLVVPVGDRYAFGLSLNWLDYGEEEVTTIDEQDGTGEFYTASDINLGLTWAMRFTDRFSLGVTGKFIKEQIWHESASTIAFDVSTMFQTSFNGMMLGMGIYNVGGVVEMAGTDLLRAYDHNTNQSGGNPSIPSNLDVYDWKIPMTFRLGASMYLIENPGQSLLISFDAQRPTSNSQSYSMGTEYGFKNRFFLRGGYKDLGLNDAEGGLSLGGGLNFPLSKSAELRMDVAWRDWARLGSALRYSLSFSW
jgi:hypothetical protein